MGNGQGKGNSNKVEWVKAFGTWAAAISICVGIATFYFKKEKEASDRLLNIITLLDSQKCQKVRAGAASTIGVYLEDYKAYQNRASWVMANDLASEDDKLVRKTILNIYGKADADAVEPLVFVNRFLFENEIAKGEYNTADKETFLKAVGGGQFNHDRLQTINEALVAVLRRSSGKGFKKLDLSEVSLVSPDAEYINLEKVRLEDIILKSAMLYRVDLEGAILHGANLEEASLTEVILKNAELEGANLKNAVLAADNLNKAKFIKADLSGANFDDANMTEAVLDEAIIYGASLANAILSGAHFNRAKMMGAHLARANLKDAELEKAILSGADFSHADLRGAKLIGANLSKAVLQGANLEGANLENADLQDANLKAAVLFVIDPNKFQCDLNKGGMVPAELIGEFEKNHLYLSESAAFSVERPDQKWLINDKEKEKEFTIRKENERLNICVETKFDFEGIMRAINWKEAIYEEDIRQRLNSLQN